MIPVAVVDQMKKNGCPTSAAVDPPVAFRVLPPPSPHPLPKFTPCCLCHLH